jgi:hypothetical protein
LLIFFFVSRSRSVYEREDRQSEPLGEAEQAFGRAESCRAIRRAALCGVGDGAPLSTTEATEHVFVHAADAVAGNFHALLEVVVEVGCGVGPGEATGTLDRIPRLFRRPSAAKRRRQLR